MDEKLNHAGDLLIEAMGRQSAFWGLGKAAGEIYAVLYLGAEPVSLEEIAHRLGVTKGNVSVAIRQLEQLGMVRRSWHKGDRRIFFAAETDLWRIARSVLSLRQMPEFDHSFRMVAESHRLAQGATESKERELALRRISELRQFYELLDSLARIALSMTPEELRGVAEMLRGLRRGVPSESAESQRNSPWSDETGSCREEVL